MKPKILYFVPYRPASTDGVLHSTVLAEAGFLQHHGFDCFFVGAEISIEQAAEAERQIKQTYGIGAKVFGCYSMRYGGLSVYLVVRKVARLSRDTIRQFHPTHIWMDVAITSGIGRRIARQEGALSVFDVQGVGAEEIALQRGRGLRYRLVRWLEAYEIKKVDRLASVSHGLSRWVQQLTGRKDIVVVPCCVDTSVFHFNEDWRREIRKECGFGNNEKVICYSGGLAKWQRIDDILEVCLKISSLRVNYKFLFLTRKKVELEQMIKQKKLPVERCVIKGCLQREVPRYLLAADAGIILRDDIVVNNVASPIKIGEYLSCGLPVILTKGIGDYSEALSAAGVGLVLDEESDMAKQVLGFVERSDFEKLRGKAIEFARKNVSWESHLDDLKRLFSTDSSGISKE